MLSKRQYEAGIFDAFQNASSSISCGFSSIKYPQQDDRADVVTWLHSGGTIEWQLGEWLHSAQTAAAKRREDLDAQVLEAIGEQKPNGNENFCACMLSLKGEVRFDAANANRLRMELYDLLKEVERDWEHNPSWQSPQGYLCQDFPDRATLGKYFASIHFEPRVVHNSVREWPETQPWIFVEPPGGAYDPGVATDAMQMIAEHKAKRYSAAKGIDFRLIVFYNLAYRYNTPFFGPRCRSFADAAGVAHKIMRELKSPFTYIYLFDAPNHQAFEVHPDLRECQ